MTTNNLPGDASSLLVPLHLDAWVVDSQNQEGPVWYYSDFSLLANFQSPMPPAFHISDASRPTVGVHLHWALPDALTHGVEAKGDGQIHFPLVPNRWLIARFNTTDGQWQSKLWVVESDFIGTATIGATGADLSTPGVTTIALASPGAAAHVGMAATLSLTSADGQTSINVITTAPVEPGDTQINISPTDFSSDLPAGSTVQLLGTSAFLDPFNPTTMEVVPGQPTNFNIQQASIGTNHTIEAWEANTSSDTGELFLQAVGPGNIHFAAYVPSVGNVFSFIDTDLPAEGTGVYTYTYMVVGWYSDPLSADPMRAINTYVEGIWKSQDEWQSQTPAERFTQLLGYMKWSVNGDAPATPPTTSLYHGLVADAEWPYSTLGNAGIDTNKIRVAVGNTAIDALAALAQSEAQFQGNSNPSDQNNWLAAGNTLAELMQASMYDLLDDYGVPGGSVLIRQQIETAWYGSYQGGIHWNVVADVPQVAGLALTSPQLTPAQSQALTSQLATLNQNQRQLDTAVRKLHSLQSDLYIMWLKVGRANSFGWGEAPEGPTDTIPPWSVPADSTGFTGLKDLMENRLYPNLFNEVWDQYCVVGQLQSSVANPTDAEAANAWANQQWTFTTVSGMKLTLAQLGLKLKASTQPTFWHPSDPVVLVSGVQRAQKHGEDGRYNPDGTLTCRLPGQTITGVQVQNQPTINVPAILRAGINLNPCNSYTKIPAIQNLLGEAFFVDPANASLMAGSVGGDATAINQGITNLLGQNSASDSWSGTAPAPFAITLWDQAWAPLFLEWDLFYFPTGASSDAPVQFSLADWHFDGQQYTWNGTGFDNNTYTAYTGRTLLTPQVPLLFKSKIQGYLKKNTNIDSQELDELITTVAGWDVLSQSLTGLSGQLITLLTQETFPPPPSDNLTIQCPRSATSPQPSVTALIGDEYHAMPQLGSSNQNYFFPVRGGFIQFQQLQVVDAFGQTVQLNTPNTEQDFRPILGQGLTPTSLPGGLYGLVQLPPRIIQDTRLDLRFLANDGSGHDIEVSDNSNAVCGWLLPNHLDGGIAVYDADGILLGEMLPLAAPDNWRPRPGTPGNNPPQSPADIPNAALRSVINSIAGQSTAVFNDLLTVIDETLWMVDPLGGRKDQFLSVLIGRPLAVVQAEVQLSLLGDPVKSHLWNDMVSPAPPCTEEQNIGGVETISFPVRLGSLELRDDGLIGYYLPADGYAKFYAVHIPEEFSSDSYVQQIVEQPVGGGPAQYQGDISLKCQGDAVTLTMLLDPRGKVHAYTGILPVTSWALPAHLVEDFIKRLKVTFRTGPIIAEPGALRVPQPAEDHGVWKWLQRSAPTIWEEDSIVDADDRARLPDLQLQLREGWLELSDLKES